MSLAPQPIPPYQQPFPSEGCKGTIFRSKPVCSSCLEVRRKLRHEAKRKAPVANHPECVSDGCTARARSKGGVFCRRCQRKQATGPLQPEEWREEDPSPFHLPADETEAIFGLHREEMDPFDIQLDEVEAILGTDWFYATTKQLETRRTFFMPIVLLQQILILLRLVTQQKRRLFICGIPWASWHS